MEKQLSDITQKEWIMYQWLETTRMGEEERRFIQGQERTPDEAMEAAEEWDFLESVKEEPENN
jgi:hypothetical protein